MVVAVVIPIVIGGAGVMINARWLRIPHAWGKAMLWCGIKAWCSLGGAAPRASHAWYRMRLCVVQRGIKNVRRELRWCRPDPMLPVMEASNLRLHGSEPPVARTGQNPWLRPGWKILPTRIGYCSNTNYVCRFRREDNNANLIRVQRNYYRAWQMEPCHRLEGVIMRSS